MSLPFDHLHKKTIRIRPTHKSYQIPTSRATPIYSVGVNLSSWMPFMILVNRFDAFAQPLIIFGQVDVFEHRRRRDRDFKRVVAAAVYELAQTFRGVLVEPHDVVEIFRGDNDRMPTLALVGRERDAFFARDESGDQSVDDLFGDHRLIDQRDERGVFIRAE